MIHYGAARRRRGPDTPELVMLKQLMRERWGIC